MVPESGSFDIEVHGEDAASTQSEHDRRIDQSHRAADAPFE